MSTPPATRMLAEFASTCQLQDVPDVVVERAKLTVLDTIGVALAAVEQPIGAVAAGLARRVPGPCTALGSQQTADAVSAAVANGTLANALDFDEGFHLATSCLPAALAMGEATDAPGSAVLGAYIVARECGARLTAAIDGRRREGVGLTANGWWHVGVVGPVAACIAAGTLLGLDVPTQQTAIGLATCASGGFRRNMGTMAKSLHSGLAAGHGVQAALLAQAGATADGTIIEAPLGLAAAATAGGQPDWAALSLLGDPFELEGHLPLKKYPTCTPLHALLEAYLSLQRDHRFGWRDVAAAYGDHHRFSLFRDYPADPLEAAFSPGYILAAALMAGDFGLPQLGHAVIADDRVVRLAAKMHDAPGSATARIVLNDGEVLDRPLGATPRLTDRAGILEKYRRCASGVLPAPLLDTSIEAVLGMEVAPSVREVTRLFAAPQARV